MTEADINEAINVIWDSCKGKERCPRKIIKGQLKWLLNKQKGQLENEYKSRLASIKETKTDELVETVNDVVKELKCQNCGHPLIG